MSNPALKILILEDNDDLREGWLTFFQSQGHYVRGITLIEELLDGMVDFLPDVYLIDLNLPDGDGLDVVMRLRSIQPHVGIVVSTARAQIGDKLLGYDRGADMYFTKPVDPQELMACIAALVKRSRSTVQADVAMRLYLDRFSLEGPLKTVELTLSETALLAGLARAGAQPLARWQLAELLGAGDDLPSDAMLEMRIARLRKKLVTAGAEAQAIRSVHKKGYLLSCRLALY